VGGAGHVRRVADVITDQLGYPAHTFHPRGYEAARSGGACQPAVRNRLPQRPGGGFPQL